MQYDDIIELINQRSKGFERMIIGIAGPPASGKSTLSEKLVEVLEASVLVPMDGFHKDNSELDELGLRHRKGAPNTFDASGFVELVKDIREGKLPRRIPEFDRNQDKVVEGNREVTCLLYTSPSPRDA